MSHALVIGGTGMLRGVCLHLARAGAIVSVVARRHARLARLATDAPAGRINPVPADYGDAEELAARIRSAAAAHGAIDTAVCWIHSSAPGALRLVADLIGDDRRPPRLFHVLGSADAEPGRQHQSAGLECLGEIRYRRVVLGFMRDASRSRWLTHDEIADGIIDAVERDTRDTVVGVIAPWSDRP